jgi:hypothetical protein
MNSLTNFTITKFCLCLIIQKSSFCSQNSDVYICKKAEHRQKKLNQIQTKNTQRKKDAQRQIKTQHNNLFPLEYQSSVETLLWICFAW